MSWTESHQGQFGSYDLNHLKTDQAFVNYSSTIEDNLWLYELSTNCLTCPYKLVMPIPTESTDTMDDHVRIISTAFPMKYRFRTSNETYAPEEGDSHKFCDVAHTNFGEFGIYEITASGTLEDPQCDLNILLQPVNIYLPILLLFLVTVLVGVLVWTIQNYQKIRQKFVSKKKIRLRDDSIVTISTVDIVPSPSRQARQKSPIILDIKEESCERMRLNSLDVFRGICIIVMIYVHDGGSQYFFMQHSAWDGLLVADVVFPWFLWIMGVCIPISLRSQLEKKKLKKKKIIQKIISRSFKIVVLGLLLNIDLKNYRFFGVLQRLGISYLICGLLAFHCLQDQFQTIDYNHYHRRTAIVLGKWGIFMQHVKDMTVLWKGWLVILVLTLLHTLIIFLLPVPDCPTGYLGPGGLYNNKEEASFCIGGATGYVDRKLWGQKLLFQWPTANSVYNSEEEAIPFDPEGTMGYLTGALQCWCGVQMGLILVLFEKMSVWNILIRWTGWSIVQGVLGGLLCGWGQTGGLIPVNKNLWSLSFVLVTNCMAGILLSFLYVVNDLLQLWSGTLLVELGMNSILLYAAHLSVQNRSPWHWAYEGMDHDGHLIQLVESFWGLFLWSCISIWLKRKKFFLKL